MIELVPSEYDDLAFLELAERIVKGAVAALQVREVYLVHVDNWFDFKWLGCWSRWKRKGRLEELRVPPFNPKRVGSEKHFLWDANRSHLRTDAGGPCARHYARSFLKQFLSHVRRDNHGRQR
jgi:hypothetical protein